LNERTDELDRACGQRRGADAEDRYEDERGQNSAEAAAGKVERGQDAGAPGGGL
jgi:hypothetical protein